MARFRREISEMYVYIYTYIYIHPKSINIPGMCWIAISWNMAYLQFLVSTWKPIVWDTPPWSRTPPQCRMQSSGQKGPRPRQRGWEGNGRRCCWDGCRDWGYGDTWHVIEYILDYEYLFVFFQLGLGVKHQFRLTDFQFGFRNLIDRLVCPKKMQQFVCLKIPWP